MSDSLWPFKKENLEEVTRKLLEEPVQQDAEISDGQRAYKEAAKKIDMLYDMSLGPCRKAMLAGSVLWGAGIGCILYDLREEYYMNKIVTGVGIATTLIAALGYMLLKRRKREGLQKLELEYNIKEQP